MNKLTPAKNVAVLQTESVHQTDEGLWLPNGDEKFRPEIGIIIAMGDDDPPIPGLKVGDRVVYKRYVENFVPIAGEKFNFIEFQHIMCRIEEE